MRPRELVLSGFRSYEAETRFCWDGRSLVGIVGPIGSGKSTILDGIALALYNQTPRSGSRTTSLINQRRDVAQVSLTFDVDGTTYKAVRSLRRSGASAHALYRIEDGDEVTVVDRAREMGETIETLLGLDFAAFQRSVLLAQNQFAEFLEAAPADRNRVLKGVFGFDRLDAMRDVAKSRLDALGNRLAVLADRRASAESDRADLETRRAELEAAEQRASALEGLRTPFEETKEIISSAQRRLDEAKARLRELDTLAERIPDGQEAETLLTGAGDAGERVEAAQRALAMASQRRAEAAEALDAVLDAVGGRTGLERAGDLVAAWRSAVERRNAADTDLTRAEERAGEADARSAETAAAVSAAETAAAEASETEEAAVAAVEAAEEALAEARHTHRVHAVRSELVTGEPCPVCEQVVAVVPDTEMPETVDEAEQALVRARTRRSDASDQRREAGERLARARADAASAASAAEAAREAVESARTTRDRAAAAAGEAASAVESVLGEGDPGERLAEVRGQAAGAQAALEEATTAETAARQAVETAREAARTAETALGDLRSSLATLRGSLGVDVEIGVDRESIAAALSTLRTEWLERRDAASEAVPAAEETLAAGRAALAELLEAADLGTGDDLAEVVAAAVADRSVKEAEVALLEKRLADLERLAADESELMGSVALLERIHGDLTASRFIAHVLDERRRALGDLASEHFETLSAGRYRFDDSGDFEVVDLTAADAIRSPSSLSGGETFLASLALALALAEIVAREGGRLDAFFLDEGFGSLDPEHLDLAMSGVERLVTTGPDRLVVVVSHVPALNERLEDLIELDRDPVTGDTRVLSGTGCE